MKKVIRVFICICCMMILSIASVKAAPAPKLNKKTLTVTVGGAKTLKVKNIKKKVKWSSSNKKIAKVSKKGLVKGIKVGKTKIKAKVSGKTLTCAVKVKNADAQAEKVKFLNVTGGDFVKGSSNATVSFVLKNTSTNVKVKFLNALGDSVYTKTFSKCKANKVNSFAWNGKKSDGKYASEGTYRVCITAGSIKTYSNSLKLYSNDFAAGDGSKAKPYQIKTLAHLKNVNKHNGKCFKQISNIDGDDANFRPLFTSDNPFNGTYDGGNYTISRLYFRGKDLGLFTEIGEEGVVKNVKASDFRLIGQGKSGWLHCGIIAGSNCGKILNCKVTDSKVEGGGDRFCGGICGYGNGGLIQSCVVQNISIEADTYNTVGGIVGYMGGRSSVIDCKSISITLIAGSAYVGGIAGKVDNGTIIASSLTGNCLLEGQLEGAIVGRWYKYNGGEVTECYTDTEYDLIG